MQIKGGFVGTQLVIYIYIFLDTKNWETFGNFFSHLNSTKKILGFLGKKIEFFLTSLNWKKEKRLGPNT
jgi:hypothetical protein